MIFIIIFIKLLLFLLILLIIRTFQIRFTKNQKLFEQGTLPNPLPHDFYKGSVWPTNFGWQGKKFDQQNSSGINLFKLGSVEKQQFPFKTYSKKGLQDTQLEVLAIDYNIPQNSWWLHPILDEIVQITPNTYLGKLHIKIIPGFPFTLAFFKLEK